MLLYSGYLDVDGKDKQIHYMFVTSQSNPTTDPVILWLNGGPGCSSLIGFFKEIGPVISEDKNASKLEVNPYNWNKRANIIFFESPAGVGFSRV